MTKEILLDQETNQTNQIRKYIGSFFCVLSVAILFTDKFTTFGIEDSQGYKTVETLIWFITQSLGPIVFAIAALLGAYRIFYFVPIYVYSIQIYWAFDQSLKVDDPLLHFYALGCIFGVFLLLLTFIFIIQKLSKANYILIKNIKKSTRFLSIHVFDNYVEKLPEKDQKKYTIDTIKFIDSLDK